MDTPVPARTWGDGFGERELHSPLTPADPIPGSSQTPQLPKAAAAPPGAEGRISAPAHSPWCLGRQRGFATGTRWQGTSVPKAVWVGVLQPPTLPQQALGCPCALPSHTPELVIAVWAVNPNPPILLNYFPNDEISLVHVNDQFHVLFLALF